MILTGERIAANVLRESRLLTLVVEKGKLNEAVEDFFRKYFHPKSFELWICSFTCGRIAIYYFWA